MTETQTPWEASVEKARLASLKTFEGRLETARASFEQFPPKGKGVPRGKTLAHFAAEAGVEYSSLTTYRDLASWWGDLAPQGKISWTTAREAKATGKWTTGAAFVAMTLKNDPPEGFTSWTVDALRVHLGKAPTNTGKIALKVAAGEKVTKDDEHAAAALDAAEHVASEIGAIKSAVKAATTGVEARVEIKEAAPSQPSVVEQASAESLLDTGFTLEIGTLVRQMVKLLAKEREWLDKNGKTVVGSGKGDDKKETIAEIVFDSMTEYKGLLDTAFGEFGIGGTSIEEGVNALLHNS